MLLQKHAHTDALHHDILNTTKQATQSEPYRNGMEVLLQPLLALAALQSCNCQVHQATLERHLQRPLCKAEHAVLGGLAGLLG